jgi:hypothetical protein
LETRMRQLFLRVFDFNDAILNCRVRAYLSRGAGTEDLITRLQTAGHSAGRDARAKSSSDLRNVPCQLQLADRGARSRSA